MLADDQGDNHGESTGKHRSRSSTAGKTPSGEQHAKYDADGRHNKHGQGISPGRENQQISDGYGCLSLRQGSVFRGNQLLSFDGGIR